MRAGAEFRDEAGVDLVGVEFAAVGCELRGQRAFSRAYFEEKRYLLSLWDGEAGDVFCGGAVGEEVLRERAGNVGGAGHGLRSLSSVKGIRADEGPDRKNRERCQRACMPGPVRAPGLRRMRIAYVQLRPRPEFRIALNADIPSR